MNKKLLLLTFGLIISSLHFGRILDVFGLFLYPLVVFLSLTIIFNFHYTILSSPQNIGSSKIFIGLMMALIVGFVFYYPYENERGHGTDRDEALNQGVNALVSLQYPYYERSYVPGKPHEEGYDNRPITVLPGSMLFASPFVLMGNSAYQNFFWITVLFFYLAGKYKSYEYALLTLIIIIFFCATFLFQLLIGSDYISNVIWIYVLTSLYAERVERTKQNVFLILFLLGLGLSSRFHFIFILFPLAFFIWKKLDFTTMVKHIGIIIFAFTIITLPFVIYDFKNFTPLHYSNLYTQFNAMISYISIIIPIAVVIFSLWISRMVYSGRIDLFFAISFIFFVSIMPLVILDSIQSGRLNLANTHYLLPFSFFFSISLLFKIKKGEQNSPRPKPIQ